MAIVVPANRDGLLISATIEGIFLICAIVSSKPTIKIDGETLRACFAMGLAEIAAWEPIRIRWWYGWVFTSRRTAGFITSQDYTLWRSRCVMVGNLRWALTILKGSRTRSGLSEPVVQREVTEMEGGALRRLTSVRSANSWRGSQSSPLHSQVHLLATSPVRETNATRSRFARH